MKLFYLFGEKIYHALLKKRKINVGKKQTIYDMKNLYPGRSAEEKIKEYYIKKIGTVLCVLTIGILFSVLSFVKGYVEPTLTEERYIERNEYGEGTLQAEVTAGFEDGSKEDFSLEIGERCFREEELDTLYEEAVVQLMQAVFPKGACAEEVRESLNFPKALPGFPFEIQWKSNNYELVDYDGQVKNDKLTEKGETVNLTAVFQYIDFRREYIFSVHVFPPLLTKEELRRKTLEDSLAQSERDSIHDESYVLPDTVGGERVKWKEKKDNSAGLLFLLSLVTALILYQMKDYELHKQMIAKQEELFICYPEIVNRLVLYIGAGMTVRSAWKKIALERGKGNGQGKRKGYVYREMLFTCYEMESGTSEGEAYEHFGRRCGLQQYVKLATLLVQNMQKGNSMMLVQLKEEAETAFTERINLARKKGEEAGTKLLMPMMLLLGMVMVFIMIPAFGTFGM